MMNEPHHVEIPIGIIGVYIAFYLRFHKYSLTFFDILDVLLGIHHYTQYIPKQPVGAQFTSLLTEASEKPVEVPLR